MDSGLVDVAHLAIDPVSLLLGCVIGGAFALWLCGKTMSSEPTMQFIAVMVLVIITTACATGYRRNRDHQKSPHLNQRRHHGRRGLTTAIADDATAGTRAGLSVRHQKLAGTGD